MWTSKIRIHNQCTRQRFPVVEAKCLIADRSQDSDNRVESCSLRVARNAQVIATGRYGPSGPTDISGRTRSSKAPSKSISELLTALQVEFGLASRIRWSLRLKRFLFQVVNVRSGRQPLGQLADAAVGPRNGPKAGVRVGRLAVGNRQIPGHSERQRSPGKILFKVTEDPEPAGMVCAQYSSRSS